jgi:hypothetical protein
MRHRCVLLLAALLGPVAAAPAQTVTVPPMAVPAEPIDWSGGQCRPAYRLWGGADYLLWWVKGAPVRAPLVTTSNTADFGTLGAPSTQLLIGGETLNFGSRSGGRFTLGAWVDDEQRFGVEGTYFFLSNSSVSRAAAVDGFAQRVIAVPFIDATPGGNFGDPTSVGKENAFVFGAPIGVVTNTGFAGIATLSVRNQLQGAEANGLFNLGQGDALRVDAIGGFRYVYFREQLAFDTSSPTVVPQIPGESFVTSDRFDGRTDFYGGQLGARVTWDLGRLSVAATGKVALGVMHQRLDSNGSFATNDFNTPFGVGPVRTFPGGYFALPTNSGSLSRDRFGVVPEVGVNLNYRVTQRLGLTVGYTFLYLNSVIRPGDQMDRTINGGQTALYASTPTPPGLQGGPARPEPLFRTTDFWAQGINFGIEFRF